MANIASFQEGSVRKYEINNISVPILLNRPNEHASIQPRVHATENGRSVRHQTHGYAEEGSHHGDEWRRVGGQEGKEHLKLPQLSVDDD